MTDYTLVCVTPDKRDDCWLNLCLVKLHVEGKLTYRELENLVTNTETPEQRNARVRNVA